MRWYSMATIIEHEKIKKIVTYYASWIRKRCSYITFEDAAQSLWEEVLLIRKRFPGKDVTRFSRIVNKHLWFRSRDILNKYHLRFNNEMEYAKHYAPTATSAYEQTFDMLLEDVMHQLKKKIKRQKTYVNSVRVFSQLLDPDQQLLKSSNNQIGMNGKVRQSKRSQTYHSWQLGEYLDLSRMQVCRSHKTIKRAVEQVIDEPRT